MHLSPAQKIYRGTPTQSLLPECNVTEDMNVHEGGLHLNQLKKFQLHLTTVAQSDTGHSVLRIRGLS